MSSNIIDNAQTQSADSQAVINPQMAIDLLKAGNKRFTVRQPLHRDLVGQVNQTATGQYPFAVILSCIDSRIPTEIIFDQGVGDIFNARVAGNFINQDILGSMEFACAVAGSKLIVVMGHTSCGDVKGACDNVELGNLTAMLDKLMPAVDSTELKKCGVCQSGLQEKRCTDHSNHSHPKPSVKRFVRQRKHQYRWCDVRCQNG